MNYIEGCGDKPSSVNKQTRNRDEIVIKVTTLRHERYEET